MDDVILGHGDLPVRGIRFSRTHLIRLERQGLFPKRIKLSPGRVGWLKSEIDRWVMQRGADRSGAAT
jgi:prophage regulatory protein